MLVTGGAAAIFFPLSLLNNGHAVYRGARRLLAIDFEFCGVVELRNKTFIATPTTTVCCFLKRRGDEEIQSAAEKLLRITNGRRTQLEDGGLDAEAVRANIAALTDKSAERIVDAAYDDDILAHAIRIMADDASEMVVGFSGDSVQEQHRVLGYRFSKSRGTEGYTVFEENGIAQTLLYDPESLDNQSRFSGAVLARFEGRSLEIPTDNEEISRFMVSVRSSDIWKMPDGLIENPSAFFVTELSVESASPYGDFIDELDGDDHTIGQWLDEGRCEMLRGATYPKEAETPRVTTTRILTASNLNLNTRQITLQQFRYLTNIDLVAADQRPVEGDIVICTASGSLKHLGKIAVVSEPIDAYIGGFLILFRCNDPIDRKILEYNLLSARFRQMVARAKEQNINNLTEAKLRPFLLHVPADHGAFMTQVERQEAGT